MNSLEINLGDLKKNGVKNSSRISPNVTIYYLNLKTRIGKSIK